MYWMDLRWGASGVYGCSASVGFGGRHSSCYLRSLAAVIQTLSSRVSAQPKGAPPDH